MADSIPSGSGVLMSLVIATLAAAVISLFTMLPLIAATLRARRLWLSLPFTLLLDATVVIAFVEIVTLIEGSRPPTEAYVCMAGMVGGFFISATAVMLLVRRLGYRLMWRRLS